jgi:hypothetical protein
VQPKCSKHRIKIQNNNVLQQNCFQNRDLRYTQETVLAMGEPTQSVFSEIYLQYLENTNILDILVKHHTFGYFRYVEDILVFYNFPTRYDLFSLLHFCRQLYMFRVLTPIIRSSYNCNYSLWYLLTGSTAIRSRC